MDWGWCAVLAEGEGASFTMAGRFGFWRGSSHFLMLLWDLHRAAFTRQADCTEDAYVTNADCPESTPVQNASFVSLSTTPTPFLSPTTSPPAFADTSPPPWTAPETNTGTFACSLRAAVHSKYAATYLISAEYRSLSRKRIWEGQR